jgi:sulfur carrier protein ThiS
MPTVRAEIVSEGVRAVDLDADATYGDLLAALGFSPHEATVLVDGDPVPEDRGVAFGLDGDVRVLRLVAGGAASGTTVDGRVRVRPADADDHLDVMRVLDGAALSVDARTVGERIGSDETLVATVEGRIVGALVRDGDRVTAVATRRRWRDRGVGTALVSAAAAGRDRLIAEFDAGVRPFYESLGFDIEPIGGDRHRGRLRREAAPDGDPDFVGPVERSDGE